MPAPQGVMASHGSSLPSVPSLARASRWFAVGVATSTAGPEPPTNGASSIAGLLSHPADAARHPAVAGFSASEPSPAAVAERTMPHGPPEHGNSEPPT